MSSNTNTNETPSKMSSSANYYQGAAKEQIGKILGNEQMQTEGLSQKLQAQDVYNAAQERDNQQKEESNRQVKNTADNVTGTVKENTGKILNNPQLEKSGKAQREQSKEQQH
ncbi:9297_t:CDS:2 [Diversispora eburnea]|uniref:9297_t:CDS:1 n=1 Tax=Diversispora eburnea TaxID=1213867 RepID=A0A9N9F7D8_9GLOM|nr:9297_t:CDS:2 [Diversispora eburnea]